MLLAARRKRTLHVIRFYGVGLRDAVFVAGKWFANLDLTER